ncbi:MAG: peroxiredoxin [Rhodospirillales bacterium]|nr:peroxiredoxin [Rhodospirillales bacterium]
MANPLEPGNKAPNFKLPRDGGGTLSLSELTGQSVVLYFYPKDDTPGCTTEAVEFSALLPKFKRAGTIVVGVSKDPVAKHDKFIKKHDLKVSLVSDEDGKVLEAYDVWVEKMNYGRKYMGIERSTFLIDKAGKIARVWRKVRVKGHVDEVLEAAKTLAKS